MQKRVLILGPGLKTHGGITSVIKAYKESSVWTKWNCHWIETYNDKNKIHKILYFIKSLSAFIVLIPFYKIVHIHFSWTVSASRKLFFFLYARLLRKKIVIHLHSGAEPVLESKAGFIYKYMFKKADVTVFLAETIKQKIENRFFIKKSLVIYNPIGKIPITKLQNNFNIRDKIILFAGTITEKKGTNDLLLAFEKIVASNPKWKLVLAGNGEIEKSKHLAKQLNILSNVEFTGWIGGIEKEKLFEKASVFCLPSYTEGFPMSVLEAWANGIPVITTPVGGLNDFIEHKENALVFEPGDINALAEQLEILIKDKLLRIKLSDASVRLSQTQFNINSISNKLNELYAGLLNT